MQDDEDRPLTDEELKEFISLEPWPGYEEYWPLVQHQQKYPQLYPGVKPHPKVKRPQPPYTSIEPTDSGRWRAKAHLKGIPLKTVGTFDTRDEAIDAALAFQKKLQENHSKSNDTAA